MTAAPAWLVPFGAFVAALVLALAVNAAVVAWRPGRDSGELWTGVLVWTGGLLAALLLYGWTLQLLDSAWWQKGWHPLFDATGLKVELPGWPPLELKVPSPVDPDGQRLAHPEWWALALPFAVWLLVLLLRLAMPAPARTPALTPEQPRPGAWLAGSAGFEHSRHWVLWVLASPFLLLLIWSAPDLGEGLAQQRAAPWGLSAVIAVTLIVIALSRGRRGAVSDSAAVAEPAAPGDWVAALRRRGFAVQTLCRLAPTDTAVETADPGARALLEQWPFLRTRRVAPELIEALADLFAADAGRRRSGLDRLVLAPDDSGQWEALAVAIQLTHVRLELVTLVIVPQAPESCVERLAPWLPGPEAIHLPRAAAPSEPAAMVWLMEVGTLSDHLADLADNPLLLARIGLTVWLDLDAYSGVRAANFWAVSHRLHRLLRRKGHQETRSLTFARSDRSHEANLAAFVSQLLPYDYRPADRVVVERRRYHPIAIHLLEPTAGLKGADAADLDHWDPSLLAARVAVEAGLSTCYEAPRALDLVKARDFMQQAVDGRRLAERLVRTPADAAARILELDAAQVLSLTDLLSQGGRALERLPIHQVGLLLPPGNPYCRRLLMQLAQDPETFFRQVRRLVPGVPQPAIVRRHLLLALREMEAVASGLLDTFQWRDTILDPVLEELANRHEIERRDVRFLDEDNTLKVDTGYRSSAAQYRPGPLDTVGDRLVAIVLREAGGAEAVLQRIDPERATIVAYPRRVFRIKGQTYRMNAWPATDAAEIKRLGVLYCTRSDDPVLTWRVSEPRLRRTQVDPGQTQVFFDQGGLNKLIIQTQYEEEVTGIVEVRPPRPGAPHQSEPLWGEPIESLAFPTQGLMLRFLDEDLDACPAALHSIAQALGQVLAVQVGVEEDAVLVMAAEGLKIGRRRESGLVILDLYPQGLGLIDALNDDDDLLRRLLLYTRDWLAECPCGADAGCPLCLQSPPAIAATRYSVERQLSRREAVQLLRRVLGT
ncbi:Zn-binding domain-containing protein [uncultured Thiodictyon sp.]|uniref:Zn-binding domain-containing protein n=1 Tax=uncultured Thiodictyon sp. TaxID=1846217 RepID=UPI0025D6C1E0|nr:Zn-binding domain-containing protein [uncultured Thiodictyon sp.]